MEGIRGTAHPLDTPLILECIFKNLRVSDLKTFRQVNRVWHEAATKCMRPVVVVKFESGINGDAENKMRRYLDLAQSKLSTFSTLPFANNYKLHYVSVYYPEFWAFCGGSIKSLHLTAVDMDSADVFRQVIFKSCPHLESLALNYVTVAGSVVKEPRAWVPPRFPQNFNLKRLEFSADTKIGEISFLELFSHFPSPEEVHLSESNDTSRIFQSLSVARKHDPKCWNIKYISFDIEDLEEPESDLQFLLDENLSLETLVVSGELQTEHINILRKILSANATTLKILKIEEGKIALQIFDRHFDRMMEKLENFSLHCARIKSLRFLRYLPNLKKLDLSESTLYRQMEASGEPLSHWIPSSCTELTLNLGFEFDKEAVKESYFQLFRRVPNVEKLSISECTNELFAGICEIFPNLICLELERSRVDDCGISGLDKEHVNQINKGGPSRRDLRTPVSEPMPNLSSLKSLKWFRYKHLYYRKNSLGFCAAQCGVLQLPRLQHLKVERCKDPIWDRLNEQFPWRDP